MAAALAAGDARLGAMTLIHLYFVALSLIVLATAFDMIAGTSLTRVIDTLWYPGIEVLAIGAVVIWAVVLWAPASALGRLFRVEPEEPRQRRVRPVVGAVVTYAALLAGVAVWHMPAPPRPPLEFVVPKTDTYAPKQLYFELQMLVLDCLQEGLREGGMPNICKRPDLYRELMERYPNVFEGERDWG